MGMLSRILLFNFLNIPFVRRHFHYFLPDEKRRDWLSHRIKSGTVSSGTGRSMYPTFTGDHEFIFLSRFDYSKNVYLRVGDVVSLVEPNSTNKAWAQKQTERWTLTKRIAGFEGYCGYVETGWRGVPHSKVIVPQGHCWVLGDNRSVSRDSRRFGPVPLAYLLGKIIWRLGPEGFNFIDHDPNYGVKTTSQSPISTTGEPMRPDAAPQIPNPPANLIFKTIPQANTGTKARLRYSVSRTERQESFGRSLSKRI